MALQPGDIVPSGECRSCGAAVHEFEKRRVAYCPKSGLKLEIGFRGIFSFTEYDLDDDGNMTELEESSLMPDWYDGAECHGFWCGHCEAWHDSDRVDIKFEEL